MGSEWLQRPVAGLLIDVTGVLYNPAKSDGSMEPIDGALEAVRLLSEQDEVRVRFLSNKSSKPHGDVVRELRRLGFAIKPEHIFTPIGAAKQYISDHNLRPHLFVHAGVAAEFVDTRQDSPNCVLMGHCREAYTWQRMNEALRHLAAMKPRPLLITLGSGRYYKSGQGDLVLDVGAMSKALEFACDAPVLSFGKPNRAYFQSALDHMGDDVDKSGVVMVGDDLEMDVGGAHTFGIRGVAVLSGKFQPSLLAKYPHIVPDAIYDNLLGAVQAVLASR